VSGKTTITVDRDVALKFSKATRENGISALRLASDSLELTIEALRYGYNPKRLMLLLKMATSLETEDAFPMPIHMLSSIFEELGLGRYKIPFYEAGKALGTTLSVSIKFHELIQDPLMFKLILPIRNATCNIKSGSCEVNLAFPLSAKGLMELFASYIRGLLDGYGITSHKVQVKENIIEIYIENYSQPQS